MTELGQAYTRTPIGFLLSAIEFDVVWRSLDLGAPHVVLTVPSPGSTDADRAHIVEQAWRALTDRGLVRHGRPVDDLVDLLSVLAAPRRAIDVRVWADREIRALAATSGSDSFGALAIIDGGRVSVSRARGAALPAFAVGVAGTLPAGPGRSVSLPHEQLSWADARAGGDTLRLVGLLVDVGVPTEDAEAIRLMCEGMVVRGQFGAEHTTAGGRHSRAERVIAFHDTPRGRYLHLVRPTTDGRSWSTISPADNRRLELSVTELLRELVER